MIGVRRMGFRHAGRARAAASLLLVAGLAGCSAGSIFGSQPEATPTAEPAAAPPPPTPPPIDLAGRWQLAAAAGGACFMNFGDAAAAGAAAVGATDSGTIAPEGGCPGSFFTSRKWNFENGALIIRDFKGRQLAQLTYVGGHFEGRDKTGSALTLSKQL
jgi:hypothetical protein